MVEGEDVPHISVAAGITVGLLASLVQSFGLTIQRLSHVANERLPLSERKRDWQRPLWLGGFAIFILSNVFGTIFQIGALPIVVLGPLGAVSLLWNAAFAKLVLGDEFTVHLVVGTVLIAGGAVLIGIFGVVPEVTHTLPELVRLYRRPPFIIWVSLLAFFLILILSIAHLTEWRLSRYLTRTHHSHSLKTPPVSPGRRKKTRNARRWSAPSRASSIETTAPGGGTSETTPLIPELASSPTNQQRPSGGTFRLSFAENESEADSNNLYSPAPSIVGGGSRPHKKKPSLSPSDEEGGSDTKREEEEKCKIAKSRVWVGAAYGATSGTLSGLCLLFTKTGIELLIMSIVGKTNQFGHVEPWLIVGVLLVCELFQLAYLNRALRLVGPTLVCPLAFCFYNTSSIISGLIYYDQWDELSNVKIGLVTLGIVVLLGGVWIVSIKSGGDEEREGTERARREEGKGEEGEEGRLLSGGEGYTDEPEEEMRRSSDDEENDGTETVAEDDEPLEWRPRGFSLGLAASSPGFDLRPLHYGNARRRLSNSTSSLPHHTALDALIRDAILPDEGTRENESPSRRRRQAGSSTIQLGQSRSMRGSLSGSLYVGPTVAAGGSGSGHRRNRSSGTTISLPATPLVGGYGTDRQDDVDERERVDGDEGREVGSQGGYGERRPRRWWNFWSSSKSGRIELL